MVCHVYIIWHNLYLYFLIKNMQYIKLNSDYVLKPDSGRALILASLLGRKLLKGIEDSFTNVIHPIYAMILSFVDGRSFEDCVEDAAKALDISSELIENFIKTLLNNPNQVFFKSEEGVSAFPPYTIVSQKELIISKRFSPEMFDYTTADVRIKRHLTPSTITLMLNNVCVTNCIYCYQDKTRVANCRIPFNRIKELIREARDLHVNTFDVIGGEFFLYKKWKEVLYELRKNGFHPYLSTKVPLKESDVKYLASLKIHDIQLSLDTLIEQNLINLLGVQKGYMEKMIETLRLLDSYNIPVMVHSVLTKHNRTIEDMESVYEKLKTFKNIIDWHVVKGEESLYPRTEYKNIEIDVPAYNEIIRYLKRKKEECKSFSITHPEEIVQIEEFERKKDKKAQKEDFFNRSFCSGLFSSLYILPNGQVTMCEQLYWNKRFIVGNVMKNSIEEVWNSQEAKSLYYIKQSDIPADSKCRTCADFVKCRENRQVCYREIVRKYGSEKWYYPDVNCPYTSN